MQTMPLPSQEGAPQAPVDGDGWQPPAEQPHREQLDGAVTNVGRQFRTDRVRDAAIRVLDATAKAQYFRHAPISEALRYAIDPGHFRPHPLLTMRPRSVVGRLPSDAEVEHW
jgi:hypothetical protein